MESSKGLFRGSLEAEFAEIRGKRGTSIKKEPQPQGEPRQRLLWMSACKVGPPTSYNWVYNSYN